MPPPDLPTDRARWAFITKTAGGRVEADKLTQVGRALKRLGVEHIPAYSSQARGRGERLNRTPSTRFFATKRTDGSAVIGPRSQTNAR